METDPKPQKRGRKPKTVKTEEPVSTENVVIEEKQEKEQEPQSLIDEIPEANEETSIDEFIEEINNEIENPSEEMKDVIEEIIEEVKEILSTIEETNEVTQTETEVVEKREEAIIEEAIIEEAVIEAAAIESAEIESVAIEEIKEAVETVTEEIAEKTVGVVEEMKETVVNTTLEIKSLLNLLIIISIRPDMQEKYGLKPELVKTLQLMIQNNSSFFFKIEESFKRILEDNKIDSNDVPELMSLFSCVYELLFSLKLTGNTIEMSNICGELIKLTFNIMLTEGLIIFETASGNEETLKIFNALVDSSTSLIKLSKMVKFNNKWCCWMW
jgi:hypothetical protein